MARVFGWAAVSPEPMTFREYALARQQQVEERIGTRIREQRAREDALARKTAEAIAEQERHAGPR